MFGFAAVLTGRHAVTMNRPINVEIWTEDGLYYWVGRCYIK